MTFWRGTSSPRFLACCERVCLVLVLSRHHRFRPPRMLRGVPRTNSSCLLPREATVYLLDRPFRSFLRLAFFFFLALINAHPSSAASAHQQNPAPSSSLSVLQSRPDHGDALAHYLPATPSSPQSPSP